MFVKMSTSTNLNSRRRIEISTHSKMTATCESATGACKHSAGKFTQIFTIQASSTQHLHSTLALASFCRPQPAKGSCTEARCKLFTPVKTGGGKRQSFGREMGRLGLRAGGAGMGGWELGAEAGLPSWGIGEGAGDLGVLFRTGQNLVAGGTDQAWT